MNPRPLDPQSRLCRRLGSPTVARQASELRERRLDVVRRGLLSATVGSPFGSPESCEFSTACRAEPGSNGRKRAFRSRQLHAGRTFSEDVAVGSAEHAVIARPAASTRSELTPCKGGGRALTW